jgi:murein DD-endopeptidase MepM/ murein hydrolase activator NlpD
MSRSKLQALQALGRSIATSALLVFVASAVLTYGVVHALQSSGITGEIQQQTPGPLDGGTGLQLAAGEWVDAPAYALASIPESETRSVVETADLTAPEPAAEAPVVVPPLETVEMGPQPQPEPEGSLRVLSGHVPDGGTVSDVLRDEGVTPAAVHEIAAAMRRVFDFRRAHSGDFFSVILDADEQVLSFEYQRGRGMVYRVARGPEGALVARAEEVPLERRVVQLAGLVDRSVFDAVTELGEGPDLVHAFADIFVWDIDFSTQVRPGDEFRMVFEKFYDGQGFVRYGQVLAAEYRTSHRTYTALYFEDDQGYGDYFTPEGTSVRRTFLRAPVNYSRISSRFSRSRLHPILKVRRPHEGIDYAAPTGTPVWAVANGEVIFKGWSGGFGRLVKVRHNNGYVSYYGHLSRYGESLKVGQRVPQKTVLGYVGSSGLSTGPHLDYRVKINGRYVDPLQLKFPDGDPVAVTSRERFERTKDELLADLREAQPAVVLEASL